MPDFTPNVGEEEVMKRVLNQTLFLGLFRNTPTNINLLGEAIQWSDILQATGFVGGNEKTLTLASWTIPTGASAGNPATAPLQTFTAQAGGADSVAGYYIRTSTNVLLAVGLNPEVESSGILKVMPEGALFRVNPQYGAS